MISTVRKLLGVSLIVTALPLSLALPMLLAGILQESGKVQDFVVLIVAALGAVLMGGIALVIKRLLGQEESNH